MIPELRDLSYECHLLQCGLTTLETRRLRGDQIEVFKIVNGYEDVDRNMFFKLKEGSRTRGHEAALVKEQCRLDMRKYSFSQRVINEFLYLSNEHKKICPLSRFFLLKLVRNKNGKWLYTFQNTYRMGEMHKMWHVCGITLPRSDLPAQPGQSTFLSQGVM